MYEVTACSYLCLCKFLLIKSLSFIQSREDEIKPLSTHTYSYIIGSILEKDPWRWKFRARESMKKNNHGKRVRRIHLYIILKSSSVDRYVNRNRLSKERREGLLLVNISKAKRCEESNPHITYIQVHRVTTKWRRRRERRRRERRRRRE